MAYKTYGNGYHRLFQPLTCRLCNKVSENPRIEVLDIAQGHTSEANMYCQHCGEFIIFWGYGFFNDIDQT